MGSEDGARSASIILPSVGLRIQNGNNATSQVSVLWNRGGFFGGFGLNVDITDAGSNQGFLVGVPEVVTGLFEIDFLLSSVDSGVTSTSKASVTLNSGDSGDVYVPFSVFDPLPGSGGADPTDVFSIQMDLFSPNVGFMGLISFVKATPDPDSPTPVPLPATLSMLMIGLCGLRFSGRRSLNGSHPLSLHR